MKKSYRGFPIPALLIILGVLIAAQLFSNSLTDQRGVRIESAKLLEYIEQGAFDAVGLEGDTAYAHLSSSTIPIEYFSADAYDFSAVVDGSTFVTTCRQIAARKAGMPLDGVTELDLGYELIYFPAQQASWLWQLVPYLLMTVLMMVFWVFIMRQQSGGGKMMNFGHSTARVFEPDGNKITFADVAGAVEEKEEMQELVEFLKNPKRFTSVGAKIP